MANLEFCDKHNMVAYLKKPTGSEGFQEIVDFLNGSHIRYALTKNPTIYVSLIEKFWQTATVRTVDNGEQEITATVDGKEFTITEASVRRHLQLADVDVEFKTFREVLDQYCIYVGNEPDGIKIRVHGGNYKITMFLSIAEKKKMYLFKGQDMFESIRRMIEREHNLTCRSYELSYKHFDASVRDQGDQRFPGIIPLAEWCELEDVVKSHLVPDWSVEMGTSMDCYKEG
ncbi:hypothetical protein Tco_1473991 [Tanacetum coccineum]